MDLYVPSNLLKGKTEDEKIRFIESYKGASTVLREIHRELTKKVNQLVMDSEQMTGHEELLVNIGQRKALRQLISMLVEPLTN